MRWFFLFLLALNVFYYVWHQQQSPLRAKEIAPLELYKDGQKNILLLAESNLASQGALGIAGAGAECASGCRRVDRIRVGLSLSWRRR